MNEVKILRIDRKNKVALFQYKGRNLAEYIDEFLSVEFLKEHYFFEEEEYINEDVIAGYLKPVDIMSEENIAYVLNYVITNHSEFGFDSEEDLLDEQFETYKVVLVNKKRERNASAFLKDLNKWVQTA